MRLVYALIRVDIKERTNTLIDAIDGTFVNTRTVLYIDARLSNHVCHECSFCHFVRLLWVNSFS